MQGANLLTGIFFSRSLSIQEFAFYNIFNSFVVYFQLFGDFGLAVSLVRQPQMPSEKSYRAVLTFQQIFALFLFIIIFFVSPILVSFYKMPTSYIMIFYAIGITFSFMAFQSVCNAKLEKELNFKIISLIESVQAISFLVLSVLAFSITLDLVSITVSITLRAFIGAFLSYFFVKIPIKPLFDLIEVLDRLKFSIFFQGTSFIFLIQSLVTPVLLLPLLGARKTGLLVWAQITASYPIVIINALQRLYFPTLANSQDDSIKTNNEIFFFLVISNTSTALLSFFFALNFSFLTEHIFGSKWLEASQVFPFFLAGNFFIATSSPLFTLINAQGRSKNAFIISLFWTTSTWIISTPMIHFFGYFGFAVGWFIIQTTNLPFWFYINRQLNLKIFKLASFIWLAPSILYFLLNLQNMIPNTVNFTLILSNILISSSIFVGMIFIFSKKESFFNVKKVF